MEIVIFRVYVNQDVCKEVGKGFRYDKKLILV